jgi:cobalamin biosynthesis protein CobW
LQLDPPPEHIIIETSGLALPKPLVKAFDWPAIRSRLTVDGVIAVVDAAAVNAGRFADDPAKLLEQRQADTAIDHDNPLEEVYEDQLLCADLIILNKTDLVDEGAREKLTSEITALVPRAVKIVAASHGKIDPKILLGLDAMAEDDLNARPSHHDIEGEHDHDDFESFVFDMPSINTPDELEKKFGAVTAQHDILRLKGFIDVRGKPMRLLVQGVGARLQHTFDRPWRKDEERLGRLVIIGQKGLDIASIKTILNS